MFHLISSNHMALLGKSEVKKLIEKTTSENLDHLVSGILIYKGDKMLQYLEGEWMQVNLKYEYFKKNPQNYKVSLKFQKDSLSSEKLMQQKGIVAVDLDELRIGEPLQSLFSKVFEENILVREDQLLQLIEQVVALYYQNSTRQSVAA